MPAGSIEDPFGNAYGITFTAVVTDELGCNMTCPLCFIDARGELKWEDGLGLHDWSVEELVTLLSDTCARIRVRSFHIHGHEITPGTWPKMKALFTEARYNGISDLGVITNCAEIARIGSPIMMCVYTQVLMATKVMSSANGDYVEK